MKYSHFLSLIIPTYKDEDIIVKSIMSIKKVLDKIRYDYEIIVVVDGEVDSTFEKLKSAAIPKTTIIQYKKNHGKSYAIRVGMHYAEGDYIMFIDSGMEIHPNGISMLIEHMEWYSADIIVGSKRHPASQVRYSTMRKILSYGYYMFVRFLFHINIRDTQAGIKIFKAKVLRRVLPKLVEKRFAGDLELLVVAHQHGFTKIYEAPIKLDYKLANLTSAATIRSIFGMFVDTLAIFYRAHITNYYLFNRRNTLGIPSKIKIKRFK